MIPRVQKSDLVITLRNTVETVNEIYDDNEANSPNI